MLVVKQFFFYEVLYGQAARSSSNNIADAELLGRILKWQSLQADTPAFVPA